MQFKELPINKKLKNNLTKLNFLETTPIQQRAIPEILEGNDLLGLAQGLSDPAIHPPPLPKVLSNSDCVAIRLCRTQSRFFQNLVRGCRRFSLLLVGALEAGIRLPASGLIVGIVSSAPIAGPKA